MEPQMQPGRGDGRGAGSHSMHGETAGPAKVPPSFNPLDNWGMTLIVKTELHFARFCTMLLSILIFFFNPNYLFICLLIYSLLQTLNVTPAGSQVFSSPVIVKIPTTQLMRLFPSRAISMPVVSHFFWSLLDFNEAQMPVPSTSP